MWTFLNTKQNNMATSATSLSNGKAPYTPFTASIVLPSVSNSQCPQSFADLVKFFNKAVIEFKNNGAVFGYTTGQIDQAASADRGLPRLMFDSLNRFAGLAVWMPETGSWTTGGVVGELKTLVRTSTTITDDMDAKLLTGTWKLCDGTNGGVRDLHANDAFFQGSAPNWDVYTVQFTGV